MTRTLSATARARMLDAAQQLLRDEGIDSFTVDAVAHRSGVAKTTIYRHFASVQELLVASLDAMIDPVELPDRGSLRADLLELFEQQLPVAEDEQLRGLILGMLSASCHDDELRRVHERLKHQRTDPVRIVLERARARGELRDDVDLDHAVDLVMGPAFARIMVRRVPTTAADVEALIDLAVRALGRDQG